MDNRGYPKYRRRDNGSTYEAQGFVYTNQHVVPYNPHILRLFGSHVNIEFCGDMLSAVKYIHKYITKGHDRATLEVDGVIDETKLYLDARYVGASEACWRIFHYPLHQNSPNVVRLQVHLPDNQQVFYDPADRAADIVERGPPETTLTRFFEVSSPFSTLYLAQSGRLTSDYSTNSSMPGIHVLAPYFIRIFLATMLGDVRPKTGPAVQLSA